MLWKSPGKVPTWPLLALKQASLTTIACCNARRGPKGPAKIQELMFLVARRDPHGFEHRKRAQKDLECANVFSFDRQ